MKAIVTGGAGFIGSHLVDRLIEMGAEVVILDNLVSGRVENINPKAKFFQIDTSEWNELFLIEDEFKNCNAIFNLAASKKNSCLRDPSLDLRVNGGSTLMLLQLAVKHGIKRFIHISTGSVYGNYDGVITEDSPLNPVSYYGVSKLAGERYVQVFNHIHGIQSTILRIFHVYGDRQIDDSSGGVVAIFRREIKEDGEITIFGDGGQERVFTSVHDIVNANIIVLEKQEAIGQVYNCASSEIVTVGELAIKLMNHYNKKSIPIKYGDPLIGDIYNFKVNTRKIFELGVTFRPFSEGIELLD